MQHGLYIVVNRVMKVPVTGIIPAQNDIVAMLGFLQFVNAELEKKTITDAKVLKLRFIGTQDEDGTIVDCTARDVVTGDEVEDRYGELVQQAMDAEEGI